jgi:hypothetical protein
MIYAGLGLAVPFSLAGDGVRTSDFKSATDFRGFSRIKIFCSLLPYPCESVADFCDFYGLASQLGLQDFAGKASHPSPG